MAVEGDLGGNDLIAAIASQDLELIDAVPLSVPARARPKKRGDRAPRAEVTLDVPIGPGEKAVVFLEDEGVFKWIVDAEELQVGDISAGQPRRRGVGEVVEVARRLRFRFDVQPAPTIPRRAESRARRKRGWLRDTIVGRVRAYVFKFAADFAARLATKHVMRFLERDVREGLVAFSGTGPECWKLLGSDEPLPGKIPNDRVPRVLLFVHGTFSSTRGSFGALGKSEWGRAFLARALSAYDFVLGFDHRTLSADPLANATDMLTRLRRVAWAKPPMFDIVAYSRGGLVARSLIEQLLPAAHWGAVIHRVVFVGSTNAGTLLAEPDNWRRFVDRYTNFALWGTRALALVPGAQGIPAIAGEAIRGVGAFVKALVTHAVSEEAVPGLAAMEPNGEFVRALNSTQPGQPTPASSFYAAVVSDFDPEAAIETDSEELPAKLLLRLADSPADALFREPNDLVVNRSSMTAVDPHVPGFVKDVLDFGRNPFVYHTNYFTRRETVGAFSRWFGLDAMEGGGRAGHRVRRGAVVAGSASPLEADNILVVRGSDNTAAVLRRAEVEKPDYIVVERPRAGKWLRYAFSPKEIRTRGKRMTRTSLERSLGLHEGDASVVEAERPGIIPRPLSDARRPATARTVVLSGTTTVGVIPSSSELPRIDEQGALESMGPSPASRRRRSMAKKKLSRRSRRGIGSPSPRSRERAAKRKYARRSTGGKASVEAPPAAQASGGEVECSFRAEMDEEVIAEERTEVELTIAREVLEAGSGRASATARRAVKSAKKLIVQVAGRRNFRVDGDRRVEISVPKPGKPQTLYFDVVASNPGEKGELWVQVRQGAIPLVTLKLLVGIVAERAGAPRRLRAAAVLEALPVGDPPLDHLIVQENFDGNAVRYVFLVDLPSIGFRKDFESKPLPGARDDYITRILNEIGDSWASLDESEPESDEARLRAFEKDLKSIGGSMFDRLVPDGLKQVLWKNREKLRGIQVFSMEPFIPWELVYIKDPEKRVLPPESRFLGELGLVRWLYEGYPPKELRLRPGRARYLAPTYDPPLDLPETAKEVEVLKKLFKAKEVKPCLSDVQELLATPGSFDLFHFAGHGEAAGTESTQAKLLIRGGDLSAVTVEQTAELADGEDARPIIVLNACESARRNRQFAGMGGFADAFVRANAGVFVGTHWSVGDKPARTFVEAFYRAFAPSGKKTCSLSEAVATAREAARNAGDATWLGYVIYGHPRAVARA